MARCFVTRRLAGDALDRLREAGHEVDVWPGELPPEPDELRARIQGAEGLLCMVTDRVDASLLRGSDLKVVANYAIGTDNVDLGAAQMLDVAVGVTPDVLTDATADLAMALLLAAARHLPAAQRAVHEGAWRTWEPRGFLGLELRDATLAVIGVGRIGSAVAERARAFGMRVLLKRRRDPLYAVLGQADAVTIHTPLTADTRGLIGARALARMKPTAILVNTARGPIVDTKALATALREGTIGAAALDVTDPEPLPADHPLLDAPNLLVLPHIGSATHAARRRMADLAVDNLLAGLAGKPLPHPAA